MTSPNLPLIPAALDGLQITGPSYFGNAIAGAGDFNGDGFEDLIIGSMATPSAYGTAAGGAYLLFGGPNGPVTDLDAIDGTNGVFLRGAGTEFAGLTVRSAGDFNGDGFADLIITTYNSRAYLVFGTDEALPASLNLNSLTAEQGLRLLGSELYDAQFIQAGDFNGDGLSDLIVSSHSGASNAQLAYIVYGTTDAGAAVITLGDVDGTNGLRIRAPSSSDLGKELASLGDVNGDGVDDFAISNPNAQWVHVVFGRTGGLGPFIDLGGQDGTDGFLLIDSGGSNAFGYRVAAAGDVNGDGFADIIVGGIHSNASAFLGGAAYVVFGKASGFGAQFDVAGLDGTNGFRITGHADVGLFGFAVSSAGDVNRDGYDDLFVTNIANQAEQAFVVFGQGGPFAASFSTASLDGTNGFSLGPDLAIGALDAISYADLNGDGLSELLYSAAQNGPSHVFIRWGRIVAETSAAGGVLIGGAVVDQMTGLGGKDSFSGMGGDDLLDGGDGNDILNGGTGADDILGGLGNDYLDGGDGDDQIAAGDGADKLFGGLGIDTLTGGAGADRFEGGDGNDSLTGGADNDYLDGGLGDDILTGGAGNDVYIVDSPFDQVLEAVGEGYDVVRAMFSGYQATDNIEAIELYGAGSMVVQGNALGNSIISYAPSATIYSEGGADTIQGGVDGDTICGGTGNDVMRGGGGADTFVVRQESVGLATLEIDQILDFEVGVDYIDLSDINAGTGMPGGGSFTYVGSSFTRHSGEMTLNLAGGFTILRLDVNGDAKADYQMKINGDLTGAVMNIGL